MQHKDRGAYMCMFLYMCVCVCVYVSVYVCVCVCVFLTWLCTHAAWSLHSLHSLRSLRIAAPLCLSVFPDTFIHSLCQITASFSPAMTHIHTHTHTHTHK